MRGEDDGHAVLGPFGQDAGQHVHATGIKARERLVEHQQRRLVDERDPELHALLVSQRELLHPGVGALGQAQALDPAVRRRLRLGGLDAVQPRHVGELVAYPHLGVEAALLGHVAEVPPRPGVGLGALPANMAGVGLEHAQHDPHCRGLARAVGPDEPEQLAGRHLEGQIVEGDHVAVAPRECVELEHTLVVPAPAGNYTPRSS